MGDAAAIINPKIERFWLLRFIKTTRRKEALADGVKIILEANVHLVTAVKDFWRMDWRRRVARIKMQLLVKLRCVERESGPLSQPSAFSLGVIQMRHVFASKPMTYCRAS